MATSLAMQRGIKDVIDNQISAVRKTIPMELLFQHNLGKHRGKWAVEIASKVLKRLASQQFGAAISRWKDFVQEMRFVEAQKAVADIQRVYRGFVGRERVRAMIAYNKEQARLKALADAEEAKRRHAAAVSIQCSYRTYISFKDFSWRIKLWRAAIMVQRTWRAHKSRLLGAMMATLRAHHNGRANDIQRVFRGHLGRKKRDLRLKIRRAMAKADAKRLEREEREEGFRRYGAALTLQRFFKRIIRRKAILRAVVAMKWDAALVIQCVWRCALAWREYVRRKNAHTKMLQLQGAMAVHITKVGRGFLARRRYGKQLEAHRERQKKLRIKKAKAKKTFQQLAAMDKAKRGLNVAWRLTKGLALNENKQVKHIQRVYRGHRARRKLKARLKREAKKKQEDLLWRRNWVLIKMQRRWKLHMVDIIKAKHHRLRMYTKVQAMYRGWKGRQRAEEYMDELWAARMIQRRWRGRAARGMMAAFREKRRRDMKAKAALYAFAAGWLARHAFPDRLDNARRTAEVELRGRVESDRMLSIEMDDILIETVYSSHKTMGPMQKVFDYFCEYGSRGSAKMDNAKLGKMLRESPGLLDKKLTSGKADLIFAKVKDKGARHVTYRQFAKVLQGCADIKFKGMDTYRRHRGKNARMLRMVMEHMFKARFAKEVLGGGQFLREMAVHRTGLAAMVVQRKFRAIRGRRLAEEFRKRRHSLMEAQTKENAALMVQKVWRGKRGFVRAAKMMASIVQEMVDPEVGYPYYYNPRTGRKTWIKPPMLGERAPDQRVELPTRDNEYVVTCPHCEERTAEWVCDNCEDVYCDYDFQRVHRKGKRRNHKAQKIPPCSECQYQASSRWCVPEDKGFCDSCFLNVHRDPPEDPDRIRRKQREANIERLEENRTAKAKAAVIRARKRAEAEGRDPDEAAAEAQRIIDEEEAAQELLAMSTTKKPGEDDVKVGGISIGGAAAAGGGAGKSLTQRADEKRSARISKRRRASAAKLADVLRKSLHAYDWKVVPCVECETWAAKWRCDVCEDQFCTSCFRTLHAKGRFAYHTCESLPYYTHELHRRYLEGCKARDEEKRAAVAKAFVEKRKAELREKSALRIQSAFRSYQTRKAVKRMLKQARRRDAKDYRQRKEDEKEKGKVTYKVANLFGFGKQLKSDGTYERDMRGIPPVLRLPKGFQMPGNFTVRKGRDKVMCSVNMAKHLKKNDRVRFGRFMFEIKAVGDKDNTVTLKSRIPSDFDVIAPDGTATDYEDPWGRDKARRAAERRKQKEIAREKELAMMGKKGKEGGFHAGDSKEGDAAQEEKDKKEDEKDDHDLPPRLWKTHNNLEMWKLPPLTQATQARMAFMKKARDFQKKLGLVEEEREKVAPKPKELTEFEKREKAAKEELKKWKPVLDEASGNTYWVHSETNETTWEDPAQTYKAEQVEIARAKEMEMTDEKKEHLAFEKAQLAKRLEARKKMAAKRGGRGRGRGGRR